MSEQYDLVLRCGSFLSMEQGPGEEIKSDIFVGIKDGKIAKIQEWSIAEKNSLEWSSKDFILANDKLVMPGLINGHCHLPMTLFRGLADDLPFEQWLRNYIFPLEAKLVSPEFVKLGTEIAVLESLLSGTTTILDMYYFETDIANVCEQSGIRALLGETFIDFPAPDNKKSSGEDWKIMDAMRERFQNHDLIQPILAPHAPYTVSDETFKKVRNYAEKHQLKITVHVSETKDEVKNSLKQYQKTPLHRLYDLGVLESHTIMAHCVHLTDSEIEMTSQKRAGIVHNPESNMKLGSGAAPLKKLVEAGISLGLGTDGPASNNDLNLFKEMDFAAKLQKFVHEDNTAMTSMMALRMATREGAKALGMGDSIGTLTEGKRADLICLDLNEPWIQPLHSISSALVYSSTGREVCDVIVNGNVLVRDRKPSRQNKSEIFSRLQEYRKKNSL